ncbi:MAG: hypothetical protein OSB55_09890 [Verrucomicrobiota bacterium]|nr:hypothetical protein [Verrucomicrobiota bacterium]
MKGKLEIKKFLAAINEFATAEEQQPYGVQVVEWVGLVPPVKELVKELFAPDKS